MLPSHSSNNKDIATFVSKQSNKTSQPGVVNFLFATIDTISFFSALGDSSRHFTGESGGKERRREREKEEKARVPEAEQQLRT